MSLTDENKIKSDLEEEKESSNIKPEENANTKESNEVKDSVEKKASTESTIFVKHTYNTKKPAQNGTKKRIIVCITAVVLCLAILFGIFASNGFTFKGLFKKDEVAQMPSGPDGVISGVMSTTEDEGSISLMKKGDIIKPSTVTVDGQSVEVDTNIESVHFVNGLDEFTFKPSFVEAKKDDTTSSAATSSEGKTYLYDTEWYIEGIDKELTVSSAILKKIEECLTLSAVREVENTYSSIEEYKKAFGMQEKLVAGFVVKFNDGTPDITVTVGSSLAVGDANYMMTTYGEHADKIYVVKTSYAEHYVCSTKEFANGTMIEAINKEDEAFKSYLNHNKNLARFDKIKIYGEVFSGKTYEFEMSTGLSADYMPYKMIAPYARPANDEFISKILGFADKGLEATALYSYKIDETDIKECGFDKPKCVVELTIKDYSFKLIIGGSRNDGTESMTAMVEGKPQAFGIDVDDIAFLVGASNDITKMFNQKFIMEDIYTIKSVEIETADGKSLFELEHILREGETDVYDTVVKKGGNIMQTQSFKLLYQRVIALSMLEFVTEAPKVDPVLRVTFNYIEDYEPRVVEITEDPNDHYHYVAWVDGTPLGEVFKTSVQDIIDSLQVYLEGGNLSDNG